MAPEALFDRKYTVKSDVYVDLFSVVSSVSLLPCKRQSFIAKTEKKTVCIEENGVV